MLWQKEANSIENIYVDILKNEQHSLMNMRLNRRKNDTFSSETRKKGNQKYYEKDYEGAMYLYNESICFAQNSENLSFGYANRSSCFFKLEMYSYCLLDIELAKDSGYPEDMRPKLERRKSRCETLLETAAPQSPPAPLFEADDSFPTLSNAVLIEVNSEYGRLISTKRDIEIGETLLVEEAFVHVVYNNSMKECSVCSKGKMNFFPCGNCADTMYCSRECENNNFHEVECNMTVHSVDHVGGESSVFLLRSIIIAIQTFTTINEFMEFVENCNSIASHEISQSTASPKSKYETFFKLSSVISDERVLEYREKAYIIFHAIMNSSLGSKFQTKAAQRFLVHLIIHHGLIIRSNAFQYETSDGFEMKLNLLASYINHSCIPNVSVLKKWNMAIVKSILPIQAGQQLFISYVDNDFNTPREQINDEIERIYGFRCRCLICTKGFLTLEEIGLPLLESQSSFEFIKANMPRLRKHFNWNLSCNIKRLCIEIVSKYPIIIGTKAADFILGCLSEILQEELSVSATKC